MQGELSSSRGKVTLGLGESHRAQSPCPQVEGAKKKQYKNEAFGTSLAVQWLGLCASTAGATGSIPGQGTKIPHAARHGQKK